ncbi:MAG: VWA domain-containing protein [Acidobacteria bacterium]|nr:VWA domain-containing protein [Acidobacteriota bacterium]
MNKYLWPVIVVVLICLLLGCTSTPRRQFVIISGSENKSLETILQRFCEQHEVDIQMQYKGSVDIMLELSRPDLPYDAVWPANSLWISLGDKQRRIKHLKSIMNSPVVLGIRRSLAEELGFVDRPVRVADILQVIRDKKLRFMMTSATQSNSGASAYMGFLYALLDNPDMISLADLHRPELRSDIRELLAGVHRSSGSSGWLKDLFLKGNYDAMINYECMIIEANQELVRLGREPLYVIYPVDGIVLADSPLGYIRQPNGDKESFFLQLQEYLLSDAVQREILAMGRRTGFGGIMGDVDRQVFNPAWGIDAARILSPIKLPPADVIAEALHLYQSEFRKPSFTVFCLDFSGSMDGVGERELKNAMEMLLDQNRARQYLINTASQDVITIMAFSEYVLAEYRLEGNDPAQLSLLLQRIRQLDPGGSTDIYTPVLQGLQRIRAVGSDRYIPAIILMTDGESNTGRTFNDVQAAWRDMGVDIPVFSIMFGEAMEHQLEQLAELTRGRVFDGRHDLVQAFRTAKGYN